MSISIDRFTSGVYYDNQQYTPQQVEDYIKNTDGEGFADPGQIKALIQRSQSELESLIKKHKLKADQPLQAETSQAGKEIAELTFGHCNSVIHLTVEGGRRQHILI